MSHKKIFLYNHFLIWENNIVNSAVQFERDVTDALRKQIPVRDLPGVSIRDIQEQPGQPFDVSFELRSGENRVQVLGEIKLTFSPRLLEEIARWIRRLKSLRPDAAVAVIAPVLSAQAQAFCIQNGIDFLDLAGNIFINVPGKFTLQRSGMRNRDIVPPTSESKRTVNVFSSRSSRILRILLENPRAWSITGISRELAVESSRFRQIAPPATVDFTVSLGSVSKAIATLEDLLLVRRRDGAVLVPEPSRLLKEWADKYKERYRWRLRSSFQAINPFGRDLQIISSGIERLNPGIFAFSGAIAASLAAPFVDIDTIDVFLKSGEDDVGLRTLKSLPSAGPTLRFIYPYDDGVFMYSQRVGKALIVSAVQTYLDLYARGGRDLKQAEVLLGNTIEPRWGAK